MAIGPDRRRKMNRAEAVSAVPPAITHMEPFWSQAVHRRSFQFELFFCCCRQTTYVGPTSHPPPQSKHLPSRHPQQQQQPQHHRGRERQSQVAAAAAPGGGNGDGESSAPLERRPARRTNPAANDQGPRTWDVGPGTQDYCEETTSERGRRHRHDQLGVLTLQPTTKDPGHGIDRRTWDPGLLREDDLRAW